uniref:Uncharacterized protein n=1 Tax=Rousettus aegyptiacus TaxID=9407 RepID=A0A7J8D6L0_ROUAE|nr:hypothetical protein HJG63_008758 [Rousettus aegyptiacus]
MDFCFPPGYIPLLDVVIQMFSTWMFSGQYLCAFNSQDSEELLEGMVKNLGWLPILVQEARNPKRTIKRNVHSEEVSSNHNTLWPLSKCMETSGKVSLILFLIFKYVIKIKVLMYHLPLAFLHQSSDFRKLVNTFQSLKGKP